MEGKTLKTKDGRVVGLLKGNVLHKTAQKSKHLFRSIGGNGSWGIDYEVLFKELPERGSVHINETEGNMLYMASFGKWREFGVVKHFKKDTVDHYTQVFLPLEYFDRVNKNKDGV